MLKTQRLGGKEAVNRVHFCMQDGEGMKVCVCTCVYVGGREKGREGERGREREGERERGREREREGGRGRGEGGEREGGRS